jgi:hypothetical protein
MEKVFTEHTHIVAIKTTGNVFCWEAVEELNVKSKNWKDLLTEEPFTRKDIIHLQDPLNLTSRTIETFDHVVKELAVEEVRWAGLCVCCSVLGCALCWAVLSVRCAVPCCAVLMQCIS